ncbi:hypothetical protein SBADM41S_09197 [Streptomyces badius]
MRRRTVRQSRAAAQVRRPRRPGARCPRPGGRYGTVPAGVDHEDGELSAEHDEQGGGEVHGEGTALDEAGDLEGETFLPEEQMPEDAVGGGPGDPPGEPGDPGAAEEEHGARRPGGGRQQQGEAESVPEGKVVRVRRAGNVSAYAPRQPVRPPDARARGPGRVRRAGRAGRGRPGRRSGRGCRGLRACGRRRPRRTAGCTRWSCAEPATTTASAHRSAADPWSSASIAASFAAKPSKGGRAAMEAAASTATAATYGSERPTPESFRRSRVPAAWSTMPVTRNSGALKRAWARIIATAASAASRLPVPASRVRKPSWLTVP